MKFELIPLKGARPIMFGDGIDEVNSLLGVGDLPIKNPNSDYFSVFIDKLRIHYVDFRVVEITFLPSHHLLTLGGDVLIGPGQESNPLKILIAHDPKPIEDVGFIIFPNIGVAATGYHDGDVAQRAITCFSRKRMESEGISGVPFEDSIPELF